MAAAGLVLGPLVLAGLVLAPAIGAGAAGTLSPRVVITPGPAAGTYATGQTVRVSVGPNSLFTPHTRIIILECADPKGIPANLPTGFSSCDGNTVNADSVIVQADGSFTEATYTLYALPNIELGEGPTVTPVCNPTSACVLYVGQNQNDFAVPKVFSAPFTFTSTPATLAGAPATTTTVPAQVRAAPSAAVTVPLASLAYTGTGDTRFWQFGAGAGLVVAGLLARRRVRRWSR